MRNLSVVVIILVVTFVGSLIPAPLVYAQTCQQYSGTSGQYLYSEDMGLVAPISTLTTLRWISREATNAINIARHNGTNYAFYGAVGASAAPYTAENKFRIYSNPAGAFTVEVCSPSLPTTTPTSTPTNMPTTTNTPVVGCVVYDASSLSEFRDGSGALGYGLTDFSLDEGQSIQSLHVSPVAVRDFDGTLLFSLSAGELYVAEFGTAPWHYWSASGPYQMRVCPLVVPTATHTPLATSTATHTPLATSTATQTPMLVATPTFTPVPTVYLEDLAALNARHEELSRFQVVMMVVIAGLLALIFVRFR